MGFAALGNVYLNLGEVERAADYHAKAFQLRDRASEREKLLIAANYYRSVTGENDKAAQTYQQYTETYPREAFGYVGLSNVYGTQGQYEKTAELGQQLVRNEPDNISGYVAVRNAFLGIAALRRSSASCAERSGAEAG